ncbi:MAG TPA: hypothetical protein VEI53_05780 [Ktedonobacteraceae bacterium]|nr:hypothetical protein [Ktedonobacteraceae bacterium]
MLERLKAAQQAQARALERYHRAEEHLQKRMARVQHIEGDLILVRQLLEDLQAHPEQPSGEIEIPAWAQYTPPTLDNKDISSNIVEASSFALEAWAAAEATEANTRLAATRAAEKDEVAEIEAEEEIVETITAVTIAEIAAERAAAAEALAEASSARTREARRQAQLAEEALGEVRVAIRNELLKGEEAQHALREAEREITKAQAELADAEATEEQALTAAMNAEAEAEVAEGMAYAAADRSNLSIKGEQADFNRESDISQKASPSQPQEME